MGKTAVNYDKRIAELDFLRGLAIVLMIGHHTIFDLRHIYGLDILAFQDTVWFMDWIRPVILFLFLTVSGISCSFSRNNFRRGIKLLLFALGVTAAFELVSHFSAFEMHVYFNVFHLLTLGIFFYALLTLGESRGRSGQNSGPNSLSPPSGLEPADRGQSAEPAGPAAPAEPAGPAAPGRALGNGPVLSDPARDWRSLLLLILSMLFLYYGSAAAKSPPLTHNLFYIFGLYRSDFPPMGDYLPLFPWFGMFTLGAAIGRLFYREKKSLCPPPLHRGLKKWGRPLLFFGRHPLLIYALHQPLLIGLIGLILKLSGLR